MSGDFKIHLSPVRWLVPSLALVIFSAWAAYVGPLGASDPFADLKDTSGYKTSHFTEAEMAKYVAPVPARQTGSKPSAADTDRLGTYNANVHRLKGLSGAEVLNLFKQPDSIASFGRDKELGYILSQSRVEGIGIGICRWLWIRFRDGKVIAVKDETVS